jgi:hypothetical protein
MLENDAVKLRKENTIAVIKSNNNNNQKKMQRTVTSAIKQKSNLPKAKSQSNIITISTKLNTPLIRANQENTLINNSNVNNQKKLSIEMIEKQINLNLKELEMSKVKLTLPAPPKEYFIKSNTEENKSTTSSEDFNNPVKAYRFRKMKTTLDSARIINNNNETNRFHQKPVKQISTLSLNQTISPITSPLALQTRSKTMFLCSPNSQNHTKQASPLSFQSDSGFFANDKNLSRSPSQDLLAAGAENSAYLKTVYFKQRANTMLNLVVNNQSKSKENVNSKSNISKQLPNLSSVSNDFYLFNDVQNLLTKLPNYQKKKTYRQNGELSKQQQQKLIQASNFPEIKNILLQTQASFFDLNNTSSAASFLTTTPLNKNNNHYSIGDLNGISSKFNNTNSNISKETRKLKISSSTQALLNLDKQQIIVDEGYSKKINSMISINGKSYQLPDELKNANLKFFPKGQETEVFIFNSIWQMRHRKLSSSFF